MCVDLYTYDVREFGQDRRSRTNSARANGHLNPIENLFSIESVSDQVRSRMMQNERTEPEAVEIYCKRFCSFIAQKIQ